MTVLRIVGHVIVLACAFGIFVMITLIVTEDVPVPAWIPFDLHKDAWLGPLLKVFGIVLLAPPAATLVASIIMLGYRPRGANLYHTTGPIEIRLAPGARYGGIGLCLIIIGAIVAALVWQSEPLGIWLFVSPMIFAALYGVVLCIVVRAVYDEQGLSSIYYGLRWRQNDWGDLSGIEHDAGPGDLVFRFGDQSQRVSVYYNGVDDLIQFAGIKLNEASLAQSDQDDSAAGQM